MSTLYDELLANIRKTASTEDIKKGLQDFSNDELVILAEELSAISKDTDLASMAKILPVYNAEQKTEQVIETEQLIQNVPNDVITKGEGDITVVAAEGEMKEEDREDIKAEIVKEVKDEVKEEIIEEVKDEVKEEVKEEIVEEDGPVMEATATEILTAILKEGAALEELIEVRAAEMVEQILKEAEDYEVARAVVEEAAGVLTDNPIKAHEYSEQMMDKARTVASAQDVPVSEAAAAVATQVVETAKTAGLIEVTQEKSASAYSFSELSKISSVLEDEYEKVAEAIMDAAEAMVLEAGMAQGLQDAKLYEFVRQHLDAIKTLAAKRDINLAQAAEAYLSGDTGSVSGVVEPVAPSPSQAPSPAKAPINSNVTQNPDEYIAEMIAPADPSVVTEEKKAALASFLKGLFKEALTESNSNIYK